MSYTSITFKDPNSIKRWLQQRRLVSANALWRRFRYTSLSLICDFGAGNGELCKQLASNHPQNQIVCYEPIPEMLAEARQNLGGIENIEFCGNIHDIATETFDVVFCLEVFEHLPPKETKNALQTISSLLKLDGIAIIGVPIEIGIPALYKGLFRMSRRYGHFDANAKNVFASFLGRPPKNRPVSQITPEFDYYFAHTGFDFREFKKTLQDHKFQLQKVSASPFSILGSWLMPEIYFTVRKTAFSA